MNQYLMCVAGLMDIFGIIFIPMGIYFMHKNPVGKATDEDLKMSVLYPIGVALLAFGMAIGEIQHN